ncbi:MAG TPA: DUF4369 domain-containing protein, partial [Parafilimonas sp.]
MIKVIVSILVFQLLVISSKANTVIVNASIKELPAGKWIYYREQGGNDARDSVKSYKGGFKFQININTGEGDTYLFSIERNYDNQNSYVRLFLDKGTVTITTAGADFKDAKLSGTSSINDLQTYNAYMNSNEYIKKEPALYEKGNELYKNHDTTTLKDVEKQLNEIDSVRTLLDKAWIKQHHSSPICAYILSSLKYSLSDSELEKTYNQLTASATNNFPAKNIKHGIDVNKLTGIGKPALEFTQTDTAGKPVSLKDFR